MNQLYLGAGCIPYALTLFLKNKTSALRCKCLFSILQSIFTFSQNKQIDWIHKAPLFMSVSLRGMGVN